MVSSVDFASVPRFSDEAIKKFPKYVYENCNQATCNTYSASDLCALKDRARVINKEALLKEYPQATEAIRTAKGEEFDWIYGLEVLEKDLLPAGHTMVLGLTIDSIIRYNGIFSRLGNINPGEFRTRAIRWAKYDLDDVNEVVVLYALENLLAGQYGQEKLGPVLRNISCPTNSKTMLLKRSHIEDIITKFKDPNSKIQFTCAEAEINFKAKWHEITPDVVKTWIEKQGRTDDKLDITVWLRERIHYFPMPSTITTELAASLKEIKEPSMHPIVKASKIWFDIVRIHISHEANKRTGKAIGSAILLAHGYLPPKIGKEDEKEYIDTLKFGFEDPQGLQKFTQFVAKMITKTHQELAASLK